MKRSYILLSLLGLIIVLLSVVQISVSNLLSTGGITLANVNSSVLDLEKQNAILKEEIYSIGSLTNVSALANKLGYVEVQDKSTLIILANFKPLAIKP